MVAEMLGVGVLLDRSMAIQCPGSRMNVAGSNR
jgi:hypothetical protein